MFSFFLFVSPRKGAQTGEQQADDRRGPFSRKYRSLTSANPAHYSRLSLAVCTDDCALFRFHAFIHVWVDL